MVSDVKCKYCDHECHCNTKHCNLPHCDCDDCEHNALDEFWKKVKDNGTHIH